MIGAVLLAAILVVRFAVLPWVDHWRDVSDRIDLTQQRLAGFQQKISRLDHLNTQLRKAYGPAVDKPLEQVQPTQVAFHKTVEELFKAAGIKVKSKDTQKVRPIKDVPDTVLVPVQVRAECQIGQLAKLLAQVRQADRLVVIDRLNVDAVPKKPGHLNLTMVLATLAKQEPPS